MGQTSTFISIVIASSIPSDDFHCFGDLFYIADGLVSELGCRVMYLQSLFEFSQCSHPSGILSDNRPAQLDRTS